METNALDQILSMAFYPSPILYSYNSPCNCHYLVIGS